MQANRLASSLPEQPQLRPCRWLSRSLNGRGVPSFGKVAGSAVVLALGSAPASSTPRLSATGHIAKCRWLQVQLGSSRKDQMHSFGHRSAVLQPMAFKPAPSHNSTCDLTLPSRGLARARRATLSHYFPLRAPCPREPLMSNVRPLVLLREGLRLQANRRASSPPEQPQLRQCRRFSRFLNGRRGPQLRQGRWLCRCSRARFGPRFVSAAPERYPGHIAKCSWLQVQLGLSRKDQMHSFGHRSAVLATSGVQASAEPQFNQRPNPSIERTRKGKARYARSSFSASRALPSRASHVKR